VATPARSTAHSRSMMLAAQPTGQDFLHRLAIAEARDSHRPSSNSRYSAVQPSRSRRRSITFHPQVVTRVEETWDGIARADVNTIPGAITEYSQEEIQYLLARQMVKQHLKAMKMTADVETRRKLNAAAADEAWRRADEHRTSLESMYPDVDQSDEAIRSRQRQAAQRCMTQDMKHKPQTAAYIEQPSASERQQQASKPVAPPPLKAHAPPPGKRLPGKVLRQESPRANGGGRGTPGSCGGARSASPRPPAGGAQRNGSPRRSGPPSRHQSPSPRSTSSQRGGGSPRAGSPRRPGGAVRNSTRVAAPPGGGSSIVLG